MMRRNQLAAAIILAASVCGSASAYAECGPIIDWPFPCSEPPGPPPGPNDTFIMGGLVCPAGHYRAISRMLAAVPKDASTEEQAKMVLWDAGARFGCAMFGRAVKIRNLSRYIADGVAKFQIPGDSGHNLWMTDIGNVCPRDNDLLELCSFAREHPLAEDK
jgi:hypothetical protein